MSTGMVDIAFKRAAMTSADAPTNNELNESGGMKSERETKRTLALRGGLAITPLMGLVWVNMVYRYWREINVLERSPTIRF